MSASHGQFVWFELMTQDVAAATDFYRAVIGWNAEPAGIPGMPYTILSANEAPMGGLMALPLDAGARPGWTGYIGVDDVDAAAARIREAGGAVHRAPTDIQGVGRFAVVADPQGAVFTVFKGMAADAPPSAGSTPGRVGWHELMATDREAAFAFYATLFGWTKAEAIEMGPMGIYQLFAAGAAPIGGMMAWPDATPAPGWRYYFNVEDINAAVARVKAAGGQLTNGPHQVPGGSWIAHCLDPQSVMFAMAGPDH